jgi:hypothetical protein
MRGLRGPSLEEPKEPGDIAGAPPCAPRCAQLRTFAGELNKAMMKADGELFGEYRTMSLSPGNNDPRT